jgi:hypothetical protein
LKNIRDRLLALESGQASSLSQSFEHFVETLNITYESIDITFDKKTNQWLCKKQFKSGGKASKSVSAAKYKTKGTP